MTPRLAGATYLRDYKSTPSSRELADWLAKDGQLLIPLVELLEKGERAIDEVIDVTCGGPAGLRSPLPFRLPAHLDVLRPLPPRHAHSPSPVWFPTIRPVRYRAGIEEMTARAREPGSSATDVLLSAA